MSDLLQAGFTVTLVGISVVFVLLTLLVGVIQTMSYLSRVIEGSTPGATAAVALPAADDELISVIGAAIRMYRRKHGYRD